MTYEHIRKYAVDVLRSAMEIAERDTDAGTQPLVRPARDADEMTAEEEARFAEWWEKEE